MKKTVFKGTINGKQFDSVQAYNEEMTRALAAGESVIAESHTETVEGRSCGECESCKCQSKTPETEIRYCMLPRFHDTEYYIDQLVTGDDDTDADTYAKELEELDKVFTFMKIEAPKLSKDSLDKYLSDVNDVVEMISDDDEENEETIKSLVCEKEELKRRIEEIDKELKICENAKPIITLYQDFYQDIQSIVSELVGDEELKDCKCDSTEKYDVLSKVAEEIEKTDFDLDKTIKSLFKNIFG